MRRKETLCEGQVKRTIPLANAPLAGTTMQDGNLLNDGQPQSGALAGKGIESLEYAGKRVAGNAGAMIAHADHSLLALARQHDCASFEF